MRLRHPNPDGDGQFGRLSPTGSPPNGADCPTANSPKDRSTSTVPKRAAPVIIFRHGGNGSAASTTGILGWAEARFHGISFRCGEPSDARRGP